MVNKNTKTKGNPLIQFVDETERIAVDTKDKFLADEDFEEDAEEIVDEEDIGEEEVEDDDIEIDSASEIAEKRANIIFIIKDLEHELDLAYEEKKSLKKDLAKAQRALEKEISIREDLEVGLIQYEGENESDLVDQLREDLVFAEEEREKAKERSDEAKKDLKKLENEYKALEEETSASGKDLKKLLSKNKQLESQVSRLKEKRTDQDFNQNEFEQMKEAYKDLESQFEEQKSENRNMQEVNQRLQQEVKWLGLKNLVVQKKLETTKSGLEKILKTASRHSKRKVLK